jgi:hypothetical protein
MSFQVKSVSAENNPILYYDDIDHFFKIYVIRASNYLIELGYITDKKPFQKAFADAYNNNGNIGTDEEAALFAVIPNVSHRAYAKNTVIKDSVKNYKNGQNIGLQVVNINEYKAVINDYCEHLLEGSYQNNSNVQNDPDVPNPTVLKLKIAKIMELLGESPSNLDVTSNLDKIEEILEKRGGNK